mmetsp:Transcript_35488/g.57135  ORF Transcript_35488/g.57135 Transcript_35488/m.57135 type:complete len:221 (+) Transcript_35488:679-1341(+)
MLVCDVEHVVLNDLARPKTSWVEQVWLKVLWIHPWYQVEAKRHEFQLLRMPVSSSLFTKEGNAGSPHHSQNHRSDEQEGKGGDQGEADGSIPVPCRVVFHRGIPPDEHGIERHVDAVGLCRHLCRVHVLRELGCQDRAGIVDNNATADCLIQRISTSEPPFPSAAVDADCPKASISNLYAGDNRCHAIGGARHKSNTSRRIHPGTFAERHVACILVGSWG